MTGPRPPYGGNPDDPTMRGYSQDPADATRRADLGDIATGKADALAWSHEGPQPGAAPTPNYGGDPYQQYPPYQQPQYEQPQYGQPQYQQPQYEQPAQYAQQPPAAPANKLPMGTIAIAGAVLVVALLGGGLAYTLTGSSEQEQAPTAPQTVVPRQAPAGACGASVGGAATGPRTGTRPAQQRFVRRVEHRSHDDGLDDRPHLRLDHRGHSRRDNGDCPRWHHGRHDRRARDDHGHHDRDRRNTTVRRRDHDGNRGDHDGNTRARRRGPPRVRRPAPRRARRPARRRYHDGYDDRDHNGYDDRDDDGHDDRDHHREQHWSDDRDDDGHDDWHNDRWRRRPGVGDVQHRWVDDRHALPPRSAALLIRSGCNQADSGCRPTGRRRGPSRARSRTPTGR